MANGQERAGLSTQLKMLLILSLGLLPLGLVAILAAMQSAGDNSERRAAETQALVQIKAQRINSALSRSALTIRAASSALARLPSDTATCTATINRLVRAQNVPSRFALFAGGARPLCTTPGFIPPADLLVSNGRRSIVEIGPDGAGLRFALFDAQGRVEGVGEIPRESLGQLSHLPGTSDDFDLELVQDGRHIQLRDGYSPGALKQTARASAPVADNRLQLDIALAASPLSSMEVLMIALPLLMWLWAIVIVWFIISHALLKPLVRMKEAVVAYHPGEKDFHMPAFRSPAKEIGELGNAFERVTQTVASHEAELEAAVERQTRLVREVHHRVKNNLQVVASLLNIHARGNTDPAVAAAHASIQRRVDALAVVHRNHYAELEENRGVALRSLIAELGSNLRAGAPASASNMAVRLDIAPYYATQDIAVSVAFLVTEVVEFAMLCGARAVTLTLDGQGPSQARLTIQSEALKNSEGCDPIMTERFERVVTGLSRQLRSAIDRDIERGCYSLDLNVQRGER